MEANVVFMGTPQFAVPALRALAQDRNRYNITVVTRPDRPAGRGGRLTPPPVKVAAEGLGLPVLQPETLKDPDFRARLASLRPDVTVLVAYGEYVPTALLDLPRRGSINLHPSLLPRWRGSTPIQSAILAGDRVTGVTIILMDSGLDTGPIIAQRSVPIGPEDTAPELSEKLAQAGAELLAEVLPAWLNGQIQPVPQPEEGVTLTRMLRKEDGLVDWHLPAEEIARRVRAFQPWPGTHTTWQGRRLNIVRARSLPAPPEATPLPPGTVSRLASAGPDANRPVVWTPDGVLELVQVQLEGKPVIEARALLSGYPQIVGSRLGT
jgi:methionyl-tRNA formyltransferase